MFASKLVAACRRKTVNAGSGKSAITDGRGGRVGGGELSKWWRWPVGGRAGWLLACCKSPRAWSVAGRAGGPVGPVADAWWWRDVGVRPCAGCCCSPGRFPGGVGGPVAVALRCFRAPDASGRWRYVVGQLSI